MLTAKEFRALALKQVGKPYVLGAEASASDPNPPRFDCSELVEWLYARAGIKITDLAAAQYNATRRVTGAPKVGDLVFLRNNPSRSNGIGHVAILTAKKSNGDWEIVEARGRAYGVVKSTLSYWKQRRYYAGLRRYADFKLADDVDRSSEAFTLRLATFNALSPSIRQGDPPKLHPLTTERAKAIQRTVREAECSVYLLTEAPEAVRDLIRKALPGGPARWKVWEHREQAVVFDSQTLGHVGESYPVAFSSYHGGIAAVLVHLVTGRRITVGAYHCIPDSLASEAAQAADMQRFAAVVRGHSAPRIIGGDGMNSADWLPAWDDARVVAQASSTRTAPTYKGRSITDRILTNGTITTLGYTVQDSGASDTEVGSDHRLIRTKFLIPALPERG